ncbi:MAG: E2/UBC family protein [Pyrinomonadaceae bacterium]
MSGQLEQPLEAEYAAITARVRRFVLAEYELRVLPKSAPTYPPNPNSWREVWEVSVPVSPSKEETLLLAIPKTFPDVLPIVFMPEDVRVQDRTIPHLNGTRQLCTFDRSEIRVNADEPEGVVMAVIERAMAILTAGTSGTNTGDYEDEFEAYWEQGATLKAVSLVEPWEEPKVVVGIKLNPTWAGRTYLFCDDEPSGKDWLAAVGYKSRRVAESILYLPLKSFGLPPHPATNGALYKRLEECDPEALVYLSEFLRGRGRPIGVLFSVPTGGGRRALGAWWHPIYSHQASRKPKQKGTLRTADTGSELSPIEIELADKNRDGKLTCATVVRVDRNRLITRTAGIALPAFKHPVNIIGCGSIGSFAAALLAETGLVERMRIVDPERLDVENVARHYCGMSDVNEYKAIATATKIRHHFPHVDIDTRQTDVLDILRTYPSWLAPSSLNLIALGDWAVERRLDRLRIRQGEISVPQCYVWVEPHLYGGHALFLRGGCGCFECAFGDAFRFRHRVVNDARGFSLREAGCRSAYMPYSGLHATEFISAVVRFLLGVMDSPSNQVFSWAGDLEAARREGVVLSDEWAAAPSFSSLTQVLEADPACMVCSA